MTDSVDTELTTVRAANASADRFIDDMPARLRLCAARGGVTIVELPASGAIRLANRLERPAPAPLVVIAPPDLPAQQIEAVWRRLCGCLFLALAAATATDTFFALLALIP